MDSWKDDIRDWPQLGFQGIYDFFVNAPACDSQPNQNFRSITEGLNYLNSGWVGKVLHRDINGEVVMKSQVRFSQTISSYHNVEICLARDSGQITGVSCNCIAGEGRCCSHSTGLAFKIHAALKRGFIGIACTDETCQWNRGTQVNVVPDNIENICNNTSKSTRNSVLAFETDADMKTHLTSDHMRRLSSLPGTLLNEMLIAKPLAPQQQPRTERQHGEHDGTLSCQLCKDIFEKHVLLTDTSANTLTRQTSNQNSALWTSQRKLRVTSSSAASVPKKIDTDPANWVRNHINPRFHGNDATRYGQQNEKNARELFQRETGMRVATTGLVVRPVESWLGASLDGIVDEDTILEIKCPTTRKLDRYDGFVDGLIKSGQYDFRMDKEGNPYLRQSTAASGYYTQVQIAMYCSQRTKCKFLVWGPKDYIIADVDLDIAWTEERLRHLRCFYFKHLLPAVTDAIICGDLHVVKPFVIEE